ncbi:hypothetical protein D5086_020099 [Populus alba]|uniref:Uncharacterized protein n=1 Tax=Populus alba TaxID=43335 RepID=A0ACC4BJ54_POPAL
MQEIFSIMPNRDGVSWNSLISGYVCYGSFVEAVKAYNLMMKDGVFNLNRITFSTMLLLVSNQGCVDLGRQIHGQIVKFGFGAYVFVGSSLVDMYAKMGLVSVASQVFDEVQERNVVMYNTMITGLLRCGMVKDSKRLFHGMKERDSISWTTMITGLIQNGLEAEAMDLFRDMRQEGMAMDQYTLYGNEEIGKWAAESLLELDPQNPAGYILLSSIYAAKGKWSNVAQLRRGMREKGARKEPGFSWIKYKSKVYIFSADDQSSPFSDQIYAELEKLNHKMIEEGSITKVLEESFSLSRILEECLYYLEKIKDQ